MRTKKEILEKALYISKDKFVLEVLLDIRDLLKVISNNYTYLQGTIDDTEKVKK